MAKITYIEHSGAEHVVDVKDGLSVMEGAVKNNIPASTPTAAAPAPAPPATSMWTSLAGEDRHALGHGGIHAGFAENVEPNSRLSCQIKVSDEIDGLVVRMPESQH